MKKLTILKAHELFEFLSEKAGSARLLLDTIMPIGNTVK